MRGAAHIPRALACAGRRIPGLRRARDRAITPGSGVAAAALQFSVRHPRVASTVVGISAPARIGELAALMAQPIPDELWAELDALAVAPEHWLD